jgi:trigger factor
MLRALERQGRTKDDLLEEWRPAAESSVRTQLILSRIMEEESIEASEEDLEAEIARQAESRQTTPDEMRQQLEEAGLLDYIRNEIRNRKLQDFLLSHASLKKGKKTPYLDLVQKSQ